MPTVQNLRCTVNTHEGPMHEYMPLPEDPSDPTAPRIHDTTDTQTRYVCVTGCEEKRLFIELTGTYEWCWGEALCMMILAEFYIDGVFVGSNPYYENWGHPAITFGSIKKFEVDQVGDKWQRIKKIATFTFKERQFAESRPPNAAVPRPGSRDPLGEITVKVYRYYGGYLVQQNQQSQANSRHAAPAMAFEQVWTEKDVKGRGIQYLIGKTEFHESPSRPPMNENHQIRRKNMARLDPPNMPYVCFRFLYRTQVHLESLGLIPPAIPMWYGRSEACDVKKKWNDESPLVDAANEVGEGREFINTYNDDADDKEEEDKQEKEEEELEKEEEDDLIVLDEMPAIFKRRKVGTSFELAPKSKQNSPGNEDLEEESLFFPFDSRETSLAPAHTLAKVALDSNMLKRKRN